MTSVQPFLVSVKHLFQMENHSAESTGAPLQMMALGLIILGAHLGGKLCQRLRLSEVTGQLVGGALVGPYALQLAGIISPAHAASYSRIVHGFHFFIFVFLSVVAFGIGEELHLSRLKKVGRAALTICLVQSAATWAAISTGFYFLARFDLLSSLLIGSIGIATAPAVTFVLMNQLRIEGRLRHVLGSLVVLDDLIEVIIFSLLLQVSLQHLHPETGGGVLLPVLWEVFMALLLGGLIYLVLRLLVRRHPGSLKGDEELPGETETGFLQRILAEHPSPSVEILLLVMGCVTLGAGASYFFHWPFLITATFAGFLVANLHSHAIFDSLKIDNIMPVLNLGFFALIGANIDLSGLTGRTALLAAIYVTARMLGKIIGTWGGCKLVGEEAKVTACLPRLMLPQAGVAAVEAVYAGTLLGRPEIPAIILPAIVFFEISGVYLVDRGLRRWRSWVAGEEEELKTARIGKGPQEAARRLLEYLHEDCVTLELQGKNKREVIEELVDVAIRKSGQHIDRAQALQVLGERERLAPTGFGHGVALPHCRLMGLDESVLVFGRHPRGIDFGGVDNKPSDIFLLMMTCARNPSEHLKLLSASAHIFGNEELRRRIRSLRSPAELIELLKELAG